MFEVGTLVRITATPHNGPYTVNCSTGWFTIIENTITGREQSILTSALHGA